MVSGAGPGARRQQSRRWRLIQVNKWSGYMDKRANWITLLIATVSLLATGCVSVPKRLAAVPAAVTARAAIPGMPGVRFAATGAEMPEFLQVAVEALRREESYLASQGHTGPMPAAAYLA